MATRSKEEKGKERQKNKTQKQKLPSQQQCHRSQAGSFFIPTPRAFSSPFRCPNWSLCVFFSCFLLAWPAEASATAAVSDRWEQVERWRGGAVAVCAHHSALTHPLTMGTEMRDAMRCTERAERPVGFIQPAVVCLPHVESRRGRSRQCASALRLSGTAGRLAQVIHEVSHGDRGSRGDCQARSLTDTGGCAATRWSPTGSLPTHACNCQNTGHLAA